MSTTAQAAPQVRSPNEFELHGQTGKIKVTYHPCGLGPPIAGKCGPELDYFGSEGKLSFRGSNVGIQNMPLGQMISVVLKPQDDKGSVSFTMLLPPVVMGEGKSENFNTFCVKAKKLGCPPKHGAQITYETERMQGKASCVIVLLATSTGAK